MTLLKQICASFAFCSADKGGLQAQREGSLIYTVRVLADPQSCILQAAMPACKDMHACTLLSSISA